MARRYRYSTRQPNRSSALMQNVVVAIQTRMQPLFADLKDLEAIVNEPEKK
ncbi:hypothetical protein X548_20045 [Stenotrophomonas maltophilia 5BA-I-2]|nr:hypothetical protein X548_20045 [Stenotrophomonas maltophilia 5BA-I-2]